MRREPNSGYARAMKLTTQIHLEVDADGDQELKERIFAIIQQEVMRYSAAVADRLEAEGISDVEIEVAGDGGDRPRRNQWAVAGVMGSMRTPTVTEVPRSLAQSSPTHHRGRANTSARERRNPPCGRASIGTAAGIEPRFPP